LQRKTIAVCLIYSLSFTLKAIALRSYILPFALLLTVVVFPYCAKNKSCTPVAPASEYAQMQAYCAANAIIPVVHPSGLFYQVITQGSGPAATANSKIVITYTGKLLDGTIFDIRTTPNNTQTDGPESPWPLTQLIEGWKVGIPLIQKGGRIQLVVPSSMAYECTGRGVIPGNTVLFFDITLVDVQ
jgi:FKBP-type peptidyl-prolyl cis-trans isomerase